VRNSIEETKMFSNFITSIASGTGITLALFYVMQTLISIQPGVIKEPTRGMELHWVRVPPAEQPPVSPWERVPDKIDEPPPIPEAASNDPGDGVTISVPGNPPPPPPGPKGGITFGNTDAMLVNIIRVKPVYPPIAEAKGLEGYVVVQFDVMANGTVTNVTVVESSNRVFEKSARDAAERFRYRARVVDGVPQPTYGIRYAFRYDME
jgi:protein TonB